ncbi:hypothetical protein K438DRAFT_1798781, partial [Mycena galopus ATCC 62051]
MNSPRIVTVFAGTGLQGSAVARALLKDGTFTPRAITRNPASAAALRLKAEGIEVVKGDPLDKASLVEALRGAEAVFAVTAIIFPQVVEGEGPTEIDQGKNMVDAAKDAGVKYFIFTSLPNMTKLSGGKYTQVLHYDQKTVIEEYIRASGIRNTILHLGAFLENLWTFKWLQKTTSGFNFNLPHQAKDKLSFTWVERDIPTVALALLKNHSDPSKVISGEAYPIINANMAYGDLAALTATVLGAEVTLITAPPMGIPSLDEMHAAVAEYDGILSAGPVPDFEALGIKISTIKEFLETEVRPRFGEAAH